MLSQKFDTILELGKGWAIAGWNEVTELRDTDVVWIAIHIHDRPDYGYWLKKGSKCSVCSKVFPVEVIGMLNMFRGLQ